MTAFQYGVLCGFGLALSLLGAVGLVVLNAIAKGHALRCAAASCQHDASGEGSSIARGDTGSFVEVETQS